MTDDTFSTQREKFPIREEDLMWEVHVRDTSERISPGQYEVSVRHPTHPYAGWAIHKNEKLARGKARQRLIYARDYDLKTSG